MKPDPEEELRAARKVIDVLVKRVERAQAEAELDSFAVGKAMATLENVVASRTRELQRREAHYRALFQNAPYMILIVDASHRVTSLNRAAREGLYDAIQVGTPLLELFDESDRELVAQLLARPDDTEHELRLDRGNVVRVGCAALPEGSLQVVMSDITVTRSLQHKLQHARRLAAIGHLAAGVAHEINNPLAVLQLGLARLEDDQARLLGAHAERIARIVRSLQTFARPDPPELVPTALKTVIRGAMDVAHSALVSRDLRVEVTDRHVFVGDAQQMEQVLVNLLINAAEATPPGGTVRVHAQRSPGLLHVHVDDAGPGIPDELIDDIFTPFVTSKGSSGSGLGLAISWGIVREHGGTIRAKNLHPGARLTVTLPAGELASRDGAPAASLVHRPARDGAPGLRVLLVEDELDLLNLLAELLEALGHEVLAASTAERAVELLQADLPDVLITDLRLPGMSGQELIAWVHTHRPQLSERTVVMSGLFESDHVDGPYLQKPFHLRSVIDVLEQVMGSAT